MKDYKTTFKELARNKQATAADHVEYFVMKAMTAKSNNNKAQIASDMIKEAFRPVSNINKLTNGMHPFLGLKKALWEAMIHTNNFNSLGENAFETRPLLKSIENDIELHLYNSIIKEIYDSLNSSAQELLDKDYMFFFVRNDIPLAYQAIQAAHAALVMGTKKVMFTLSYNPEKINFVVCSVAPEELVIGGKLRNIILNKMTNVELVEFKEPDLNNEVTCICTTPIPYSHKGVFGSYKLMKFPELPKIVITTYGGGVGGPDNKINQLGGLIGDGKQQKYFPEGPVNGRNGVYIQTSEETKPSGLLTLT